MKPAITFPAFCIHKQHATRPLHLTPRELEVLGLLCEGLPNKLISRRLNISAATVKCHISRILDELGVSSRLQAVVTPEQVLSLQQLVPHVVVSDAVRRYVVAVVRAWADGGDLEAQRRACPTCGG